MERIEVVGGIKAEPSNIYLPPSSGESIDITFEDIDIGSDEELINTEPARNEDISEHCELSDDLDVDKSVRKNCRNDFKYIGYNNDANTQVEIEECIFNFVTNEDLVDCDEITVKKEIEEGGQENVEAAQEFEDSDAVENDSDPMKSDSDAVENNVEADESDSDAVENDSNAFENDSDAVESDFDDVENDSDAFENDSDASKNDSDVVEIDSDDTLNYTANLQEDKQSKNGSIRSAEQYSKYCREKFLREALFRKDLSSYEYKCLGGTESYRCLHCRYQDTLSNIKIHIIREHRKTKKKPCPYCGIKTKVLSYHIKMDHQQSRHPETALRRRFNRNINLKEARFKDDLSYREYRYCRRSQNFMCLHCRYRDNLPKIKAHIILEHRRTKEKQCPYCYVNTKVLSYHIRMDHPDKVEKSRSTVTEVKRLPNKKIDLQEAKFKEDLSYQEYRCTGGSEYMCLHCRLRDKLSRIKSHIIRKHRKTETKQCLYCHVKTKVLSYHIRMKHKEIGFPGNEIPPKKKFNLTEAKLKDDLSSNEYKCLRGNQSYMCLHCRYQDTLSNIKIHIIRKHKKTEKKQCPYCEVKTKVMSYHIRMKHKLV